jgi:hypothetical protein
MYVHLKPRSGLTVDNRNSVAIILFNSFLIKKILNFDTP